MAQIDSSIYFQNNNSFGDGISSGMKLGQAFKEGQQKDLELKKKKSIDEAISGSFKQNPDGSFTMDRGAAVGKLSQLGYGSDAFDLDNKLQKQSFENQDFKFKQAKQQLDMTAQLLNGVKDQATYDQAKAQAQQYGMKIDHLSPTYNPNDIEMIKQQTQSYQQQLDNQFRSQQAEYGKAKDDKAFGLEENKFEYAQKKDAAENTLKKQHYGILEKQNAFDNGIKLESIRQKNASGENLPLDQKKIVEGLAGQNATKLSIKNNIEALTQRWDELSEPDKVVMGKQLIKTLNSTEGKDAVGAEEAKRLASRLEYSYGNFTNDNPTQFGRDLSGFKKQAVMTAENIGTGVKANQKVIDEAMGRNQAPSIQHGTVEDGYVFMGGDPANKKNWMKK